MKAKDTVMIDDQLEIDWTDSEGNTVDNVTLLKGELLAILLAQAEISFKAGEKQERERIIKDLEANNVIALNKKKSLDELGLLLTMEKWQILKGREQAKDFIAPIARRQYIGRKDENGVEIYDGDILLTDEAGWKAQVISERGAFWLRDNQGGFSVLPNWEKCKVIGNIHENPELLT